MAEERGVLVIGEVADGALSGGTLDLLAGVRHLIDSLGGEPLSVLLAEANVGDTPQQAIAGGADTVYVATSDLLAGSPTDGIVAAAEKAVKEASPRFVIGSKSLLGRDVMPRLAFRLGTALAQDCVTLELDAQQRLLATRPVYGGNALATVTCLSTPAVASLRAKSYDAAGSDPSRQGQVVPLDAGITESTITAKVVDRVEQPSEGLRLEDASIIVGGGRGLGGPEPFEKLQQLADLLHGAVGASRAACDAGWVPHSYQIGLTGKTVTPDLYITVGISGASQHMAGCSASRTIVAINKDSDANMFKEARYGVAGDWQKVLPAFIDQVHELLS